MGSPIGGRGPPNERDRDSTGRTGSRKRRDERERAGGVRGGEGEGRHDICRMPWRHGKNRGAREKGAMTFVECMGVSQEDTMEGPL